MTVLLHVADLGVDALRALTYGQIATVAAWRTREEALATEVARTEAVKLAERVLTAAQDSG